MANKYFGKDTERATKDAIGFFNVLLFKLQMWSRS